MTGYDVILEPGESAILVEALTPEQFVAWWGADNLPPHLKVVPYTANGLYLYQDQITVWDATETDRLNFIDRVIFATAIEGFSRWFAPSNSWFIFPCTNLYGPTYWGGAIQDGVWSVPGEYGAFRAALGCDYGSPGWTPWTPPFITSIRRDATSVTLTWKAQPGSTNVVLYRGDLVDAESPDAAWTELGRYFSTNALRTAIDNTSGDEPMRFYRVVTLPNCPCVPYVPPY